MSGLCSSPKAQTICKNLRSALLISRCPICQNDRSITTVKAIAHWSPATAKGNHRQPDYDRLFMFCGGPHDRRSGTCWGRVYLRANLAERPAASSAHVSRSPVKRHGLSGVLIA